jgi:hypothetical protein
LTHQIIFTRGKNVKLKKEFHIIQSEHLFSRLLSKNLKIKIYKTIILSVVLHGFETNTASYIKGKKRLRISRYLEEYLGSKG